MQTTTFIGPDGYEYSLDQAGPRSFHARQHDGVWSFTFFHRDTGEPTHEYRGPFPTAFDRDRWVDLKANAHAASGMLFFGFGALGGQPQVA